MTISSEFVLRPPIILVLLTSYEDQTDVPQAWKYPARIQIPLSSSHYCLMGKIYYAKAHYTATAYVPEQAIFLHHNDCEAKGAVRSFTDSDAQEEDLIEANGVTAAAVYYLDGGLEAQQSIVAFRARYLEHFSQVLINRTNPSEEHPINRDELARSSAALLSSVKRGFFTYKVTDPKLFEHYVAPATSASRHEQNFFTAPNPPPATESTTPAPIIHPPLGSTTPSIDANRLTSHSENPFIPPDTLIRSLSPMSPGNLAQTISAFTTQPDHTQPITSEKQLTQPPDEIFLCICGLDGDLSALFANKLISKRMHLPKCAKCHHTSHGRCATDKTYPRGPEASQNSRWVCDLCLQNTQETADYEAEMEEARARAEDALSETQRARHGEDLELAQNLLGEAQQHPLCEHNCVWPSPASSDSD